MSFVLDASVTLAWAFEDEGGEYATAVLEALPRTEAVAALHWGLEVTNGLAVAERRKRIDAPAAARFIQQLLALPVAVDPMSRSRVFDSVYRLSRTHGLSSYDAAYLELASRVGWPLASLDGPLLEAAEREGVERFQP